MASSVHYHVSASASTRWTSAAVGVGWPLEAPGVLSSSNASRLWRTPATQLLRPEPKIGLGRQPGHSVVATVTVVSLAYWCLKALRCQASAPKRQTGHRHAKRKTIDLRESSARSLARGRGPCVGLRCIGTPDVEKMSVNEPEIDNLLQWFEENGGYLHPDVRVMYDERYSGRAFFARRAIVKDEALIHVPIQCRLCSHDVATQMRSELPDWLRRQDLLAWALLQEMELGQASRMAPYVDSLPPACNFPIAWPVDDLQLLEVSLACKLALQQQRAQLRRAYDWLSSAGAMGKPSMERFEHAACIVSSRGFDLGGSFDLVPFFDLLNHRNPPHVYWQQPRGDSAVTVEDDRVTMLAAVDLEGGHEIFNFFGQRADSDWLLNYGFVPKDETATSADVLGARGGGHSDALMQQGAVRVCLQAPDLARKVLFTDADPMKAVVDGLFAVWPDAEALCSLLKSECQAREEAAHRLGLRDGSPARAGGALVLLREVELLRAVRTTIAELPWDTFL